jgi:hypothetical protein
MESMDWAIGGSVVGVGGGGGSSYPHRDSQMRFRPCMVVCKKRCSQVGVHGGGGGSLGHNILCNCRQFPLEDALSLNQIRYCENNYTV